MHKDALCRKEKSPKRRWFSIAPLIEKPMSLLKPVLFAAAFAFVSCANNNPMAPQASQKASSARDSINYPPGMPIEYRLDISVTGMSVDLSFLHLDPTDSTREFFYRTDYGDGTMASGSFVRDSAMIGAIQYTYSMPGRYLIRTRLCQNPSLLNPTISLDSVAVEE